MRLGRRDDGDPAGCGRVVEALAQAGRKIGWGAVDRRDSDRGASHIGVIAQGELRLGVRVGRIGGDIVATAEHRAREQQTETRGQRPDRVLYGGTHA